MAGCCRGIRTRPKLLSPASAAVISEFSPNGLPWPGKFVRHASSTSATVSRSRAKVESARLSGATMGKSVASVSAFRRGKSAPCLPPDGEVDPAEMGPALFGLSAPAGQRSGESERNPSRQSNPTSSTPNPMTATRRISRDCSDTNDQTRAARELEGVNTNRPYNVDNCHHEVREARRGDPARLLRRSASRNDSLNIKGRWYKAGIKLRGDRSKSDLGTRKNSAVHPFSLRTRAAAVTRYHLRSEEPEIRGAETPDVGEHQRKIRGAHAEPRSERR